MDEAKAEATLARPAVDGRGQGRGARLQFFKRCSADKESKKVDACIESKENFEIRQTASETARNEEVKETTTARNREAHNEIVLSKNLSDPGHVVPKNVIFARGKGVFPRLVAAAKPQSSNLHNGCLFK